MKILLLSAYDTDSHKSWCQGLQAHLPQVNWTYLTLPGRHFSWRIRGNALSWVYGPEGDKLHQDYDVILATSMVDLATLKGLVPNLANTPCIMYFHENQFAYPKSQQQHRSIEPQMVNLFSALSAQTVLFNSQYNRESFLSNAAKLLKQLPDHAPISAIKNIEDKSEVLPVPIAAPVTINRAVRAGTFDHQQPLQVIWNHRWEYDKGPESLLKLVQAVEDTQLPIRFVIAGLSFRSKPDALQSIESGQYGCVSHIGTFANKHDYYEALSNCHVVLSTALHEFQGLAMLEGAAYGCIPLAPNRLAYPEWISPTYLYPNSQCESEQTAAILQCLENWIKHGLPDKINVEPYYWDTLSKDYESTFRKAVNI